MAVYRQLKSFLFITHWSFTYFIAFVFPGVWLPAKRKSKRWPALLVLSLQVLSSYLYIICFIQFFRGSTHGAHTAINFRIRRFMVCQIVYASLYFLCLLYLNCLANIDSWMAVLRPADWAFLNISLYLSVFLAPWNIIGESQRQTIIDVVATMLSDCSEGKLKCNLGFIVLMVSVYFGLYTIIATCCLTFCAFKVRWNSSKWRNREKFHQKRAQEDRASNNCYALHEVV